MQTFIGNLAKDAKFKEVNGCFVADFTIVSERHSEKDGMTVVKKDYVQCSFWKNSKIKGRLRAGELVLVSGSNAYADFFVQDGRVLVFIKMDVDDIKVLTDKRRGEEDNRRLH
ncbi:MAG: single-stranded DNA-binding protein [Puia sp.]|nr:single-stranded DNA-binding protein [Puia sp.]